MKTACRAHNEKTDATVAVGLAHKLFHVNALYKEIRHKLPENNWLFPPSEVPYEENTYVVTYGSEENEDLWALRYALRFSQNVFSMCLGLL
jgi:hypothetical protein